MNDQNAIVRSVALRTLTSIKVEAVSEVVLSALRACSVDLSPFVRKCAATSLVKVSELDRSKIDILMDLLVILLQDSSGMVLAPAISALNKLFPSRTDLLHKHYRRICGILRNCNEFDQLVLIETLEIYSRQYLKDPRDSERKDWDQDFEIFVKECEYLLCSSNPGVVMKISNLIFQLRDMQLKALATKAIVRLFSRPRFEKIVLLGFTVDMVRIDPTPWFDHLSYFYCLTDDRDDIVSLKLNVLELLKTTSNRISIMMELECYSKCQNQYLATASVLAWRNLAITFPDLADQTLLKMVMLLSSKNVDLVGQIIVAIRRLLRETKNSSASQEYVIESLLPVYSTVEVPLAKSSILWLISQNPKSKYASDAVRIALKSFAKEDARVKKQILTTSIVVWLQNQLGDDLKLQSFAAMALKYCLKLAQFDIDYDVRDHGRVVNGLRGVTMKRPALIRKVIDILTRNDIVSDEKQPQSDVYLPGSQFRPGTLSNWLNQRIDGYEDHLAWTLVTTFSEERNVVVQRTDLGKKRA